MQGIQFATFSLLSLFLLVCRGDDAADLALQQAFGRLEGDVADMRDFCLQNSTITLNDLKVHKKAEDVPEVDLCFYKCFYEKIGFIDKMGKLVVGDLKNVPELKGLEVDKIDEVKRCMDNLDPVLECTDLRKTQECFNFLMV